MGNKEKHSDNAVKCDENKVGLWEIVPHGLEGELLMSKKSFLYNDTCGLNPESVFFISGVCPTSSFLSVTSVTRATAVLQFIFL